MIEMRHCAFCDRDVPRAELGAHVQAHLHEDERHVERDDGRPPLREETDEELDRRYGSVRVPRRTIVLPTGPRSAEPPPSAPGVEGGHEGES